MKEIRAMSPGKLGHGCRPEEVMKSLEYDPHFIAVDGGSVDPGAYYLGSGEPFFHPVNVRADLKLLLKASRQHKIPLIIGNTMTNGTNAQVAMGLEMLDEVCRELGMQVKVATVQSEIDKEYLKGRVDDIQPLGAPNELTEEEIDASAAIVAQMGVEPLIAALETGADVVLAGRACDDALFAALPVKEGFDQGLAMHMGKILECGSMSCVPGDLHGSLVGFLTEDAFILDPPAEFRRCAVHSVASHTLYEREDPYHQAGPGGINDLTDTQFEQLDERRVRVSGSRWITDPVYKLKLEGSRLAGYRTICMTGVRDPILIGCIDDVLAEAIADTEDRFAEHSGNFEITSRQYGRNAVMGSLEPETGHVPLEIGLLLEVVAPTQELASAICMYLRGSVQHAYYPGILATAGNLAYPFSPFTVPCGPAYRFNIEHLLPVSDPLECFPISTETVGRVLTNVR